MPPLTPSRQGSTFNLRAFWSKLFSVRVSPSSPSLPLLHRLNLRRILRSAGTVGQPLSGVPRTLHQGAATATTSATSQPGPPTFTRPTEVFDATVDIGILPNVTKVPYFAQLVASIDDLRLHLIHDETLRQPLLHVLQSLYESDDTKNTIQRLRPTPPTHNDIISFVDQFWPEIHLVQPGDSLSESSLGEGAWDGVWGSTPCGVQAVPYPIVAIIMPLVKRWLQDDGDFGRPKSRLSANALCWFTNTVIAHEALHRLIVWWSKGECDSPDINGIARESGSYIERVWYGGVTVAEFPKDKKGVFNEMLSVGVEIGDLYFPIDRLMAGKLLRMDTTQGLPLFRPLQKALPPNPGTIRVKSEQCRNFIMSTSTSRAAEPKIETVTWRHLQNDKIRYDDRYDY